MKHMKSMRLLQTTMIAGSIATATSSLRAQAELFHWDAEHQNDGRDERFAHQQRRCAWAVQHHDLHASSDEQCG